jgi:hypothetical protein
MSTRNGIRNHFEQFTTTIYGSEYADVTDSGEILPEDYQNHLDRKYVQKGGIDVDEFRSWCEALDADQEWIEETEKRLF